jgi:hypothetical protein
VLVPNFGLVAKRPGKQAQPKRRVQVECARVNPNPLAAAPRGRQVAEFTGSALQAVGPEATAPTRSAGRSDCAIRSPPCRSTRPCDRFLAAPPAQRGRVESTQAARRRRGRPRSDQTERDGWRVIWTTRSPGKWSAHAPDGCSSGSDAAARSAWLVSCRICRRGSRQRSGQVGTVRGRPRSATHDPLPTRPFSNLASN